MSTVIETYLDESGGYAEEKLGSYGPHILMYEGSLVVGVDNEAGAMMVHTDVGLELVDLCDVADNRFEVYRK